MDNQEDGGNTGFKYSPSEDDVDTPVTVYESEPTAKPDEPLINWSSVNSYANHKTFSWYLAVILLSTAVSVVVFLITKDRMTQPIRTKIVMTAPARM